LDVFGSTRVCGSCSPSPSPPSINSSIYLVLLHIGINILLACVPPPIISALLAPATHE
uniref:Uncharacterized protein n=1 Tax=Ascaris lumbricoides TaxID=6252 RepID=A0A9J2Q1Y0_ASCLU